MVRGVSLGKVLILLLLLSWRGYASEWNVLQYTSEMTDRITYYVKCQVDDPVYWGNSKFSPELSIGISRIVDLDERGFRFDCHVCIRGLVDPACLNCAAPSNLKLD